MQLSQNTLRYGLLSLLLIFACFFFLRFNIPVVVDDAPITYRYAENLSNGLGFVYNAGERVIGTTTPLYTLILAFFGWLGLDIPSVSDAINLLASLGVVAIAYQMGYKAKQGYTLAFMSGVFALFAPMLVEYSMGGMEAPVYTFFILLAIYLYNPDNMLPSAIAAALATWTRVDGGTVAVAIFVCYLLQQRRISWQAGFLYAALILPWFIFAYLYAGSILPQSLGAKQQEIALFSQENLWMLRYLRLSTYVMWLGFLTFPFLLYQSWRDNAYARTYAPLLIWFIIYVCAYILVRIQEFPWYAVPASTGLYILVAASLNACIQTLSRWLPEQNQTRATAMISAIMVIISLPFMWQSMTGRLDHFQSWLLDFEAERVEMTRWIAAHQPTCSRMLAGAIGHLGYQNIDAYIFDAAGLVSDTSNYLPLDERLSENNIDCFMRNTTYGVVADDTLGDYQRVHIESASSEDIELWARIDLVPEFSQNTSTTP